MKSMKILASVGLSILLFGGCAKQVDQTAYPEDITKPKLSQYELNVISDKIYMNETYTINSCCRNGQPLRRVKTD